eukprot:scaffold53152_cov27-Phaeocystis_antarctica.AAC.1
MSRLTPPRKIQPFSKALREAPEEAPGPAGEAAGKARCWYRGLSVWHVSSSHGTLCSRTRPVFYSE